MGGQSFTVEVGLGVEAGPDSIGPKHCRSCQKNLLFWFSFAPFIRGLRLEGSPDGRAHGPFAQIWVSVSIRRACFEQFPARLRRIPAVPFICELLDKGKVLYEASDARMGQEGGG